MPSWVNFLLDIVRTIAPQPLPQESEYFFTYLPQAPVLFKGIGHSINPANNLVCLFHLMSMQPACTDLR